MVQTCVGKWYVLSSRASTATALLHHCYVLALYLERALRVPRRLTLTHNGLSVYGGEKEKEEEEEEDRVRGRENEAIKE